MHYRQPVYNAVAKRFSESVVCGSSSVDPVVSDFETTVVPVTRRAGFSWQHGVVLFARRLAPDAVWIAADINCLSSLALTLWCKSRRIPVILHGQGLVKQSRLAPLREIMLKTWIRLATIYVGYADVCTGSLARAGVSSTKLTTIDNRLEAPVAHNSSDLSSESGVLFVGRLRPGCEIGRLIDAVASINGTRDTPVELHIVGDGEERTAVKNAELLYPWLIWHGEVTAEDELREIARVCAIGVYPGAAGLSVLTYMQLGLAPVVGSDLSKHMGPEPSWVLNNENGWTFDFNSPESLATVLESAFESPQLPKVRNAAMETFNSLHRRSYGTEMADLISGVISERHRSA